MPIISATVTWSGAAFHLKLDTAEPVEAFRLQLQKLTGVPCAAQKIMGFPGGVLRACTWSDVALKEDKISVAMCGEAAPEAISSSGGSCVTVSIVTTQGAVISLPGLPTDCLVGRIKLMISQAPHSCGAPGSLKLVYKGKILNDDSSLAGAGYEEQQRLHVFASCPLQLKVECLIDGKKVHCVYDGGATDSVAAVLHAAAASLKLAAADWHLCRDEGRTDILALSSTLELNGVGNRTKLWLGNVGGQRLVSTVSQQELNSMSGAVSSNKQASLQPLGVRDRASEVSMMVAALKGLDEATGGGVDYVGRFLAGLRDLPAFQAQRWDAFVDRETTLASKRRERYLSRLLSPRAEKRVEREAEPEYCLVDVIPPCSPQSAGGSDHDGLFSDPLLQSIRVVLAQVCPGMSIERSALLLSADLLNWAVFACARNISPDVRINCNLADASHSLAVTNALKHVLPENIFKYAVADVEKCLESVRNCGTCDARAWGLSDTGLQVDLNSIVSSCEEQQLQVSHSVAVPLSAVAEHLVVECFCATQELQRAAQRSSELREGEEGREKKEEQQRCITLNHITKATKEDADLKVLFEPFWVSRQKVSSASALSSSCATVQARKKFKGSEGCRHAFKLKSSLDGSVTTLDIGDAALADSFACCAASDVGFDVIVLPVATSAIAAVCSLVQRAEQAAGDSWFGNAMQSLGIDDDAELFASVFKAADFLGFGLLVNALCMSLESPRVGHELERLCACLDVPLSRIVFKRLGLPDEASASALFDRVLKAPLADLSYSDLQLCDGLFLRASQCCSLGLVVWTQQERTRRSTIANETMRLNAEAGAKLSKADMKELNVKLWDAVEAGDVASANEAFLMGACADLFRECRDPDESAYGVKKAPLMPFSEYLRRNKFNGELMNGYGSFPRDLQDGLSTLMLATQRNDLRMISWLLDAGCNVNAAQPETYGHGDGFSFGGMTALAFTVSIEAMNLLLSRGASAAAAYTPPQYESNMQRRSILVGHLEIMSSNAELRDAMAMALIRHGADANDVGYTCYDDGQDAGVRHMFENPPMAFWPGVVARCDVECARELLQLHNADPNWPACDVSLNQNMYGLGATVLQIAVLKRCKPMIELLLQHGADVNLPEQVFVDMQAFSEYGFQNADEIFFLDKGKCMQYWGACVIDQIAQTDIPEEKKATALSIALANGCSKDIVAMLVQAGCSDDRIAMRSQAPVVFDFLRERAACDGDGDNARVQSDAASGSGDEL